MFDMLPAPCASCQRLLATSPLSELPAADRAVVADHLGSCATCRQARQSLEHTGAIIQEMLRDEAPEDVLALLTPEAVAVIRDLPAERVAQSPQAALLARLRATGPHEGDAPAAVNEPLAFMAAPALERPVARLSRGWRLGHWAETFSRAVGASLRRYLSLWRMRLAYGGVGAHRPVPTRMLTAHFRPRHRWEMHLMLNNFDVFSGVLLTLIVTAIVWPVAMRQPWFWLWPVSMFAYTLIRARLTRSARIRAWLAFSVSKLKRRLHTIAGHQHSLRALKHVQDDGINQVLHFALALGLLIMALVFTITMRESDRLLQIRDQSDTATWLLFSLPILWLSRYSSMVWIVVMTCLATGFNVALHMGTDASFWPNSLPALLIQTAWIVILCMLPTILARYVAEMGAGMHAAVDVVKEIARIRAEAVEEFANVAAAIIARRMNYEDVNILQPVVTPTSLASEQHHLRLIGAASLRGRRLAHEGFILSFGEGVCGRAAALRRDQLLNDVTGAPRHIYVPQDDFGDTLAELAIPILIGNDLLGVLDLQATTRYAFSEDDVLLLRAVVTHLGVALQHLQAKQVCRLATVSAALETPAMPATTEQYVFNTAEITNRLFAHRDVRPLLEEIASVIRGVLGADLVVLYPTKPTDPGPQEAEPLDVDEPIKVRLEEPIWEGVLRTRVGSAASFTKSLSKSAVGQVLLNNDALFIDDARHRAELIARDHVREASSFVEREGVLAVAALPLFAHANQSGGNPADEMLGVMFVNFRHAHHFTDQEENWCRSLAHLAALALQNSRQYQQKLLNRETVAARLRGVSYDLALMQRRAAEVIVLAQTGGESGEQASASVG
jgi:GAF domain-containing protein